MKDGFVKIAAVTPKIKVADPIFNGQEICKLMIEAAENGAKVIVFPELCLTGYTCQDLFMQDVLLYQARRELLNIIKKTTALEALILIGLPIEKVGKLYNVAAVIFKGELLAFIPKVNIPNYAEFYEARYFTPGNREPEYFEFEGTQVLFGTDILFEAENFPGFSVAAEICEDIWVANPPSTEHAAAGASILINLSASNETIGKSAYRELLVKSASARLLAAYVYASAGDGESTQDVVFSGHNLIAENGTMLAESKCFACGILYGDVDVLRLQMERRKMNTFHTSNREAYLIVEIEFSIEECRLTRTFNSQPFVPSDPGMREERCNTILNMQSLGLKKRIEHIGCQTAIVGISGGLDSTLALLVTVRAFAMLGLSMQGIIAVTMPCFGTTDRTYQNACKLAKELGVTLREIDIKESVIRHFQDIGHEIANKNVVYENGQARERTQVLMDIANELAGIVIGTGDMSELALGWATYNGDHMSMYGVNVGVPKTLVKHLVRYYADTCNHEDIREVLMDVLDTPVSPELLPPSEGVISQKTEDIVGPYELHDFFLYYALRFGYGPKKIYRIAKLAFVGEYDDTVILKWLRTFYYRFFSQQFKRSCLPDGPKIGSVALSPRGDLRMPSDASVHIWKEQLDAIK